MQLLRRNYRQQQIRFPVAARIYRVGGADIVVGAVVREVRGADAVARADIETDLVAFFENHRGRPDFDAALDDFIGCQPLALVVRVVRPVGQRLFRIELAVRGAQPALGDAGLRFSALPGFDDIFAVGTDVADGGVDVAVFRTAGKWAEIYGWDRNTSKGV